MGVVQAGVGVPDGLEVGGAGIVDHGRARHGEAQGGAQALQAGLGFLYRITSSAGGLADGGPESRVGGSCASGTLTRSRVTFGRVLVATFLVHATTRVLFLFGRREIWHVGQQVGEHDLGGHACGEAVAGAHGAESLPFAQFGGQGVQVGGPGRRLALSRRVGGQVEAGVQVGGEAGEGRTLLLDTGLDEIAGGAGELEVL